MDPQKRKDSSLGRSKKVPEGIRDTKESERNEERPIHRIMGKSSKGNRIVCS
jgi:hypothetical protein